MTNEELAARLDDHDKQLANLFELHGLSWKQIEKQRRQNQLDQGLACRRTTISVSAKAISRWQPERGMLIQLNEYLEVRTPLGIGLAVIYESRNDEVYWTVILNRTGAIVCFKQRFVKATRKFCGWPKLQPRGNGKDD